MERTYEKTALFIVSSGIACGLDNPIGWAVNAWRTPGGTMDDEYYDEMKRVIPRFLAEFYECVHLEPPTADKVRAWIEAHYKDNEYARQMTLQFVPLVEQHLAGSRPEDSPT